MTAPYRLYGGQYSPFSHKVASFLRYKGIEHVWIERAASKAEEFNRYAKLPLLPLLVGADDSVLQDSTAILEVLSRRYPEPLTRPEEPALGFLAALLEDFADEWVNKALQVHRWGKAGQSSAAAIAQSALGEAESAYYGAGEAEILARMEARKAIIGLTDSAGAVIEASFLRTLGALSVALQDRPFLFGDRPTAADFSLAAQLAQLQAIPQVGAMMGTQGPEVSSWLERMQAPEAGGEFLPLEAALNGLEALLQEITQVYLPWLQANARAQAAGQTAFEVSLLGRMLDQAPQRYAAKALAELRRKRGHLLQDAALAEILNRFNAEGFFEPFARHGGDDLVVNLEADPGDDAGADDADSPSPMPGDAPAYALQLGADEPEDGGEKG